MQQGTTRDVSTRGVYLIIDQAVSRDADLDLTMVLPTGSPIDGSVFVRAAGRVVRVEEWSESGTRRNGVAAVIRRYEIVRTESFAPPNVFAKSL